MKKAKKFISIVIIVVLACACFAPCAFAATPEGTVVENSKEKAVTMAALNPTGTAPKEIFSEGAGGMAEFSISGVEQKAMTRDVWNLADPIFVGNGQLTSSVDFYIVSLTTPSIAFLKLASGNTNLMALVYQLNSDGTVGNSTGLGVMANGNSANLGLTTGNYVIAVGSSTGNERGNYTLMWNRSNPASGAKYLLNQSNDLTRVVLFYSNNQILSNGTNIVPTIAWEDHKTWVTNYGYTARDMVIDTITSSGTYLGSFSSSAPYSTSNALFIEIARGSYLYKTSVNYSSGGDVSLTMDWNDPSGLKTPRWLGDTPTDFNWGSHYIVIDLNTFAVVEFLSPFNYYYTDKGGRTYTLSNISQLG